MTGQQDDRDAKLAAIERRGIAEYESLDEPEKMWFTITRLIFCIRSGGLPSYFYNGYSTHVSDCVRFLETLGAKELRDMVVRMSAIDWGRSPGLLAVMGELLRSWSGASARQSQKELSQALLVESKLDEYLERHRIT